MGRQLGRPFAAAAEVDDIHAGVGASSLRDQRSAGALEGIRRFMLHHNDAILLTLLLVLGAKLIGDGIGGW